MYAIRSYYVSEGNDQRTVLEKAWQGDPISAFGSIIVFNTLLTKHTVEFFELNNKDKSKRKFIEVIIAPKVEDDRITSYNVCYTKLLRKD